MTQFTIKEWRLVNSGALWGVATVTTPSGLQLNGCMVFRQAGERWVKPPSKPRLKNEKVYRDRDGRVVYEDVITFVDKARQTAFSEMALAALDEYLAAEHQDGGH